MESTTTSRHDTEGFSPIVFYYFNLTGTESFCALLEERFRESGHHRPIDFREWNCYKELPGEDGDLFAYDGVVLTALASKGIIAPLPKGASAGDVFPWVTENSKVVLKAYGLPFMMCSNALICRKKDDLHVRNIMELSENVAIPMRSMLMFYFIQTACSNLDPRKGLRVLEHLVDLIGGRDFLAESRLADYDGINRFNRGECRYLLSFTESLHHLAKDDYAVSFANFSEDATDRKPLFMVDYVSLGTHLQGDKLRDCLDLAEIMVDEQFIYDVCTLDGQLQYFIPANRKVYGRLAELDPIYGHLHQLLESEKNGVLGYGGLFYEVFYTQSDILLQFLWEKAGWKP